MKKALLLIVFCHAVFFNIGCDSIENKVSEKVSPLVVKKLKSEASSKFESLKTRFTERIDSRFNQPKEIDIPLNAILHFSFVIDGSNLPCRMRKFVYKNHTYYVMAYLRGMYYAIQKEGDDKAIICLEASLPYEQVMNDDAFLVEKLYLRFYDTLNLKNKEHPQINFIKGGLLSDGLPKKWVIYDYQEWEKKYVPLRKQKEVIFKWDEVRYSYEIEKF